MLKLRTCETIVHQVGAAVAAQRVPGETAFTETNTIFGVKVQVYPSVTDTVMLPDRLMDATGNTIDSEGSYAS